MFVAGGGRAGAGTAAVDDDAAGDEDEDEDDEDDGFEDAQGMDAGGAEGAAWLRDDHTTGSSGAGGFVNAADEDAQDDAETTPDPGYWTGDSSGQAGELAAELATMSVSGRAGGAPEHSASSSSALHAVVGRTEGTALVRLPSHATAVRPGAAGSAVGAGAGAAPPSGVLARRGGRRANLSVTSGASSAASDADAFVSPAAGGGSSSGFARGVSPINTPEDVDGGDVSASLLPRGAAPPRRRPATDAVAAIDDRVFAAARAGASSSSSSSSSSLAALAAPSRPLPAGSQARTRIGSGVSVGSGSRPLSRGGAAALAASTPPRAAMPAAPATASGGPSRSSGLSVTPGSRRGAGAPAAAAAGFSLPRTGSSTRERRARASLDVAGSRRSADDAAWQ